jgi:hypothetical protein
MFWLEFTCKLNNNYIVMADQDEMMKNVTQYVKNWIDTQNAGSIVVETFYNRSLNRGVVHCITNRSCTGIIQPITYTTHTHIADIIFHI